MRLVTLTDVRRHLNITGNVDDNELEDTAQAAEELVLELVRPVLPETIVSEPLDVSPSGLVLLPDHPVNSVTAVTDSAGATVEFTARPSSGRVFVRPGAAVVATYTVGPAVVPDNVRRAVLEVTGRLWTSQRARRGPPRAIADIGPDPSIGSALPQEALDLIRPYLKPPGQLG